jgi:hypothetical protein
MAEAEFERRLERLFGRAPELPDAGAFAERVTRRLDAGWTARRWMIGAAGVAGGLVGASQLMVSNLFQRVASAGDTARLVSSSLHRVPLGTDVWSMVSTGGTTVWVAAALAVVMTGFVLTRVIGEI